MLFVVLYRIVVLSGNQSNLTMVCTSVLASCCRYHLCDSVPKLRISTQILHFYPHFTKINISK